MRVRSAPALAASLLLFASAAQARTSFREVDLASDLPGRALHTDSLVVNPWGIVQTPSGAFRVANNATQTSTAFGPAGVRRGPVFDVGAGGPGPTGIALNQSNEFVIHDGGGGGGGGGGALRATRSRPAQFIFCTLDGALWAWNANIDNGNAQKVSSDSLAAYTGLTIARFEGHSYIYVANFRGGKVEVYDTNFDEVDLSGDFDDPDLPDGYAPFNVQNIDGRLFVAYAVRGPEGDEERGDGLGIVDEFGAGGNLVRRFASNGTLNAPWGLAQAPGGFGSFGGAIIVGNFGDGRLNAFSRRNGKFLGQLEDSSGTAIEIEGLWGIAFASGRKGDDDHDRGHGRDARDDGARDQQGNDGDGDDDGDRHDGDRDDHHDGDRDDHRNGNGARLYFAAGIDDEAHGLVGYIAARNGGHRDDDDGDDDRLAHALRGPSATAKPGGFHELKVSFSGVQPVRLSAAEGVSFRIDAPAGAALDFAVYDAAGRLVAQPARGQAVGAEAVVRWDARGANGARVSPGAYFWRATAAGRTLTGRVVLLP